MWGVWTFAWQGSCHVFYLEDVNADHDLLSWQKKYDHVGHAVSDDLIHWETRPSLCVHGGRGQWNDLGPGRGGAKSGQVIHHEGVFYLYVGATQSDGLQVVGVWTSPDLDHWEEHPANPVMRPAGPHYLDASTKGRPSVCWRDPHIFPCEEDGFYHAVLCSRLPQYDPDQQSGTAIGHLRSKDLIHWEHLPPLATPGDRFWQIEEPEVLQMDGRYYVMFEGGTTGGMRTSTPTRDDARGTFYMIGGADLDAPFTRPADDLLIGNGLGSRCASTGRALPWQGAQLFLHFCIARRPMLGTPKQIRARTDGTLYLEYMPVLEKLETEILLDSVGDMPTLASRDAGHWHRADAELWGHVNTMGTACSLGEEVADLHLYCTISGPSAARAGVVLRIDRHGDSGVNPRGIGIILDFAQQRVFLSDARSYPATGWYCKPLDDICRVSLRRDGSHELRCFARGEHFEVYLDNRWIFTAALPEAPATGTVELMVERGKAAFSDLHLAAIEPLVP
jgi:beta-fructofuranosidase